MPAVAVIRRMQALSGFIGRKESRRRFIASYLKGYGLTIVLSMIRIDLEISGRTGTFGGAVKCVDIERNTKSEGKFLVNS